MHAAAAIASGLATVVVCHRARNRGAKTSRPWSQERGLVIDDKALHVPWGLIRPVDVIGMWAHRHMHEYGTTREHLGNVAIAARKHAQRNPYAMMRDRPLDMETYLAGRVIGYPLHALRLLPRDRRRAGLRRHLGRARARPQAEAGAGARRRAGVGPEPGAPRQLQHARHADDVGVLRRAAVGALAAAAGGHGLRPDLRRLHAAGDHGPRGLRLLQARRGRARSPRTAASRSAARCRC